MKRFPVFPFLLLLMALLAILITVAGDAEAQKIRPDVYALDGPDGIQLVKANEERSQTPSPG